MRMLEQPFDVLRQFRYGDLDAFEELFRRHQSEVYRWIVRIVRDPAVAEDLTIETFWRIYRAHARFDPKRNFEPWARRIATNAALDHLKTELHDTCVPHELLSPPLPDPGISEELRREMGRAFHRLPPTLRITATLALIEEQPYKDIAEALRISTGAVKVRVYRALRVLRRELKKRGMEP
jgi:RNA polymerase sigma-70 factor, ECF subfamily